ncbi:MAG: hypothetical protein ACFE0P_09195 [Oceanicaulis sp.]
MLALLLALSPASEPAVEWRSRVAPQTPAAPVRAGHAAICSAALAIDPDGAARVTCVDCTLVDDAGPVTHRRHRRAYERAVRVALDQWRAEPAEDARTSTATMNFTVSPVPGGPVVPAEGSPGAAIENLTCHFETHPDQP